MPAKNVPLTAVSGIFLLLASAHIARCAVVPGVLESLALPRIAELTHTSASTAAVAASSAFSEVKNYFGDFHHGVKRTFHEHFRVPYDGDDDNEGNITSFSEKKNSSSKLLTKSKSSSTIVEKILDSEK